MNSLLWASRMGLKSCAVLAGLLASALSASAGVTRDTNGWTQITPSADSRLVYVSNAGSDANNGLSPSTPKATIAAANSLIRDGYPDHLLLRRGDTFTLSSGLGAWKSGRNANEPIVFSYYGTSGARPVVKITNQFIDHGGTVRNFQVFKGVEIYKSNSDPASSDFTGASSTTAMRFVGGGANLRIEDCRIRFLEIVIQSYGSGTYTDVEVRRNIVLDAWVQNSFNADAKMMGMYVSGVNGYLIEENFFDHNGWSEVVANAGANQYNHNIYVQYDNAQGGIMRGNILTRGAAHGLQARSGGEIDRNLFALNAIGFNIGGVGEPTDPDVETWPNFAHDNVVLNGRLMSTVNSNWPRTNAVWGIWEDSFIQGASVDGNIVANRINNGNNASYNGIENMDFGSNISYNWDPSLDMTNPAWPHPGDDLGDYNASIGGSNSTTAYLDTLRNRALGTLPWDLTAYAAINYIRAGFLQPAITGVYAYPGGGATPVVTIAATDPSAGEPSNGGQFTLTASPAPSSPITVNLTRTGTASNAVDYQSLPATVTIGTGGTAVVSVTVIDDALVEPTETVILTVATGSGYTPGSPNSATVSITSNDGGAGNLLSYGSFEPNQATVLFDMSNPYTLGGGTMNKWFGRVGSVSSQNTTYQTSGSNHYVTVGGSANTNGCLQAIAWPGSGTRQVSFKYRGGASSVRIYGGNSGNTINKFDGNNTLTLLHTIANTSAASWTTKSVNVALNGSYGYLVIALRGGDFDDVSIAP